MSNKIVGNLLFLMVFSFILVFPNETAKAESVSQTYESQSGIGFYGEYKFPNEEKETLVPDEEKLCDETFADSSNTIDMTGNNGKFPQTGMKNTNYMNIGIFLLIIMCVIVIKNIKNKKEITA